MIFFGRYAMLRSWCFVIFMLVTSLSVTSVGCTNQKYKYIDHETVYVGSVEIKGPASADSLRGIELITGNLTVNGEVSDAGDALESLIQVQGDLDISGLSDLSALSQLVEIGGTLTVEGDRIESLRGLDNLSDVGGLTINRTKRLKDFTGLKGFAIHGDFNISENAGLTSLSGLSIHSVKGNLSIEENPALTNIELTLMSVGGSVVIIFNDALLTIDDLPLDIGYSPTTASKSSANCAYELTISANNSLTEIKGGAETIFNPGACIRVSHNPSLETLQVKMEAAELEELEIMMNPKLDTVDFLNGPSYVRYDVIIDSTNLKSLDGIQPFEVGCYLSIENNPQLSSIPADFLVVGNHASISNNPSLPQCAVDTLAERLANLTWHPVCRSGMPNTLYVNSVGNDTDASCE
jgi:hypothetical protein